MPFYSNSLCFIIFIFSLVNLTSALKALFLFLDYNVRMLCDFNPFLHMIYTYGSIHFICLIQIKKYRDIYTANQPKKY